MPRKVRDANLETRTARSRLTARHDPFYRLIEPGLHLGYRKLSGGPGTWLVRRRVGTGTSKRYSTENLRTGDGELVLADDFADADGVTVMTFGQAQERAQATSKRREAGKPYTVAEAMADYLQFLEHDGRSAHSIYDARHRIEGLILPALGNSKIDALTTDRLRKWRNGLASAPRRLRTRKGQEQQHRAHDNSDDAKRARRASANRTWTVLRAALNFAYQEKKVADDLAWRKVTPFRGVDAARIHYLSIAEAKRLLNACDQDFRRLVQGALETGCRYGELTRLEVRDFSADGGTVAIRQSKSGKPRHVVLSVEGRSFFEEITAGRAAGERLFLRPDGQPWGASHQLRLMSEASKHARIDPPISFHGLRHTWASLSVMAGMPLMVVARNLGHADTRMVERHYGHLAADFITDAVRKSAPRFGFQANKKVAVLK